MPGVGARASGPSQPLTWQHPALPLSLSPPPGVAASISRPAHQRLVHRYLSELHFQIPAVVVPCPSSFFMFLLHRAQLVSISWHRSGPLSSQITISCVDIFSELQHTLYLRLFLPRSRPTYISFLSVTTPLGSYMNYSTTSTCIPPQVTVSLGATCPRVTFISFVLPSLTSRPTRFAADANVLTFSSTRSNVSAIRFTSSAYADIIFYTRIFCFQFRKWRTSIPSDPRMFLTWMKPRVRGQHSSSIPFSLGLCGVQCLLHPRKWVLCSVRYLFTPKHRIALQHLTRWSGCFAARQAVLQAASSFFFGVSWTWK